MESSGRDLRVIAVVDPGVLAQDLGEGTEGNPVAIGAAATRSPHDGLAEPVGELGDEPRLPRTSVGDDRDEVCTPVADCLVEHCPQRREVAGTAHQRGVRQRAWDRVRDAEANRAPQPVRLLDEVGEPGHAVGGSDVQDDVTDACGVRVVGGRDERSAAHRVFRAGSADDVTGGYARAGASPLDAQPVDELESQAYAALRVVLMRDGEAEEHDGCAVDAEPHAARVGRSELVDQRIHVEIGEVAVLRIGHPRPLDGDGDDSDGATFRHAHLRSRWCHDRWGRIVIPVRRRVECRVLAQHLRLELAQLPTRLDAELVAQVVACPTERRESVGLTPAAVEGPHQQRPRGLARRVVAHERFEGCDGWRDVPALQLCGDQPFHGVDTQRLEPSGLGLQWPASGEVGVGGPAPPRQGGGQFLRRGDSIFRIQRSPTTDHAVAEGDGIHEVGCDGESIAARAGLHHRRVGQVLA